jgi:hypothetical protein
MRIDGADFELFLDYDRGKFHCLSFPGKVTYMRERVERILLQPCKTSLPGILQNQLGLVVATAICAMISAASTFFKGGRIPRQDGKSFKDFVKSYMDPLLQTVMTASKHTRGLTGSIGMLDVAFLTVLQSKRAASSMNLRITSQRSLVVLKLTRLNCWKTLKEHGSGIWTMF